MLLAWTVAGRLTLAQHQTPPHSPQHLCLVRAQARPVHFSAWRQRWCSSSRTMRRPTSSAWAAACMRCATCVSSDCIPVWVALCRCAGLLHLIISCHLCRDQLRQHIHATHGLHAWVAIEIGVGIKTGVGRALVLVHTADFLAVADVGIDTGNRRPSRMPQDRLQGAPCCLTAVTEAEQLPSAGSHSGCLQLSISAIPCRCD